MPTYLMSPTFWLVLLCSCAATFGGGVYAGVRWEKSDNAESVIVAQNAAIEGANKGVEAATKLALEQAARERDARVASRTAKLAGELDAIKKSRPECGRDATSMRLLHDAICAANGEEAAKCAMPSIVRPAASAGGIVGTGIAKLGIFNRGSIRDVPSTALGLSGKFD